MTPPDPRPELSVIVPVRNEASYIETCIRSILEDEPPGRIEVLVVDGDSDDGTGNLVRAMASRDPRVRVIPNPCRFVPQAMNLGIAAARAPFIGRIDGHCEVVPGYFRGCLDRLRSQPVDCVGGALSSEGKGSWGRAIAAAQSSVVGVGSARFRTGAGGEALVDTVAFGVYRRDVFERVGSFDETFLRNQDDEFNLRLVRAGGKILLVPSLRIRYFVRPSLSRLGRQYFQYGYWKWRVFRKHRRLGSVRQVLPSLFLLAVGSAAVAAVFTSRGWLFLVALVGPYVGAISLEAVRLAVLRRGPAFRTALALATLHVSYGAGLIRAGADGLLSSLGFRRAAPSEVTR